MDPSTVIEQWEVQLQWEVNNKQTKFEELLLKPIRLHKASHKES